MDKNEIKALLAWASDHLNTSGLFKNKLLAAITLLERLQNHTEILAELLTKEEPSSEPIKVKLSYE